MTQEFARVVNWDQEIAFPELGVAVTVKRDTATENKILVARALTPAELRPRPKRLTHPNRKR